jgi:hypothetical protein
LADSRSYPRDGVVSNIAPSPTTSLVLVNVDILERIFSFFDPAFFDDIWDIDRKTRKYLLSAALTCKSFFEPATNLLWKTMESMILFFKILPEFVKASASELENIYVGLFLFLEHKNQM